MGRGRQVIGGSLHANLDKADIRQIIFEGFLPVVSADAEPTRAGRTGLHEMGLPYVSDPAITRHLASFLRLHSSTSASGAPLAVLFNGGVFQPASLRDRLIEVMRHWYATPEAGWEPLVLANPSLDLAVAWGAAYFGWLKHTGGRRIGGGIARSYYLGIADQATEGKTSVLCVVPQRLEEGQEIALEKPELELALGQPVSFPLYTSTVRAEDRPGDLLQVGPGQLLRMSPLHTILRGGKRSGTRSVPVTLAARSTEIGTLELWCVAKEGGNRWRLEFNVRDILVEESPEAGDSRGAEPVVSDVWPEEQVQEAAKLIRGCYLSSDGPAPQDLTKALEAGLDAPRHRWPTGLCRRLWEFLAESAEERRRSPAHLSRWYHLVGYCLRPGFGDSLDKYRVEQLWKLMQAVRRAESGITSARSQDGGADYWIMWRRVAGGLNRTLQQALFDRLRPVLIPGKGKGGMKPGANELAEMWRAAASLERLDLKHKETLGETLLKQLRRGPAPTHGFWALTRLGARTLLYGPLNAVVHHEIAGRWLDSLLSFEAANQSERLGWAFCLTQLARRTGQRALDVDDARRQRVLEALCSVGRVSQPVQPAPDGLGNPSYKTAGVPEHWIRLVEEGAELEGEEQSQMFGESLPIGLRLLAPSNEPGE